MDVRPEIRAFAEDVENRVREFEVNGWYALMSVGTMFGNLRDSVQALASECLQVPANPERVVRNARSVAAWALPVACVYSAAYAAGTRKGE